MQHQRYTIEEGTAFELTRLLVTVYALWLNVTSNYRWVRVIASISSIIHALHIRTRTHPFDIVTLLPLNAITSTEVITSLSFEETSLENFFTKFGWEKKILLANEIFAENRQLCRTFL